LKADGAVAERAARAVTRAGLITTAVFALAGLWVAFGIEGYAVSGPLDHNGPSNPLGKTVLREIGAWLDNYRVHHWLIAAPVLGFAGSAFASLLAANAPRAAFAASAIGVAGIIATAGVSLFPFLMPSSTHPSASLTVWDASSSRLTLFIILLAARVPARRADLYRLRAAGYARSGTARRHPAS
jgi:cytochrome bd ubiquinol oxidase subunit II